MGNPTGAEIGVPASSDKKWYGQSLLERRRPWFHTVLHTTGPYLSHTCLTRHLKVQTYENKCEVEYAAQKGNEFER